MDRIAVPKKQLYKLSDISSTIEQKNERTGSK